MNIDKIINGKKLGNSFSQSVYLIDKEKVLKIYNNLDKGQNELDYLNYFSGKINVPGVIDSGIYEDKFYIIIDYVEGENYTDEENFILEDDVYRKIGILLGKMHSLSPLREDTWKDYMLYRIERNYKFLKDKNVLDDIDRVYDYLKKKVNILDYSSRCMHADFRMGNLILNDDVYLLDLESVKSGDPVFDFVKLYRIFSKNSFQLLKEGYESVRKLDLDFEERLHFYNLYDAFTTAGWCIEVDRYESDFYNFNMRFLKEEMKYIWKKEATQEEKDMDSSLLKRLNQVQK